MRKKLVVYYSFSSCRLYTCEPDEVSWLYFLVCLKTAVNIETQCTTTGGVLHAWIKGGTQQLSEKMGSLLSQMPRTKILLNSPGK